jgi:Lon protease-like protein
LPGYGSGRRRDNVAGALMEYTTIPLFPLGTVLFPGGPLKLRIFEARYVDMIGRCMREDSGFGVALIVEGREAGGPARTAAVGTLARIVDFEQLDDGLLGITARGERRFRIVSSHRQSDGLNIGQVQWLPDEPPTAIPAGHSILADLVRQAFGRIAELYGDVPARYDDAGWIGFRLAEILPLALEERQECLEMSDAVERLERLRARLDIRSGSD